MDGVKLEESGFESALKENAKGVQIGAKIDDFVLRLKRRTFTNSFELTRETLSLLRLVVNYVRWSSPADIFPHIRAFARRLERARPNALVVGNASRRVMHLVREEYLRMLKENGADISLLKRKSFDESVPVSTERFLPSREIAMGGHFGNAVADVNLRSVVVEGITEMLEEMDNLVEPISKQALEHVHADDVVLVFGYSSTVEVFLAAARRKRVFKVFVVEGAPQYSGHKMAKKLSSLDIETTVVSDSAVFALMARVNKVLIGTHAVMANGGLMANCGTHMVALAAKHHSVPVVCITGLYKLCPLFPYNRDSFLELTSPGSALVYSDLGAVSDKVQVVSPLSDYVPPDLISLFVTNTGGHQPSYIYRLLAEYYDINAEEEF